jgi:hypothetical protein
VLRASARWGNETHPPSPLPPLRGGWVELVGDRQALNQGKSGYSSHLPGTHSSRTFTCVLVCSGLPIFKESTAASVGCGETEAPGLGLGSISFFLFLTVLLLGLTAPQSSQ